MPINQWTLQPPLFPSFVTMLDALSSFRVTLRFKALNQQDQNLTKAIQTVVEAMEHAEKTLKLHLFQLFNASGKRFSAEEVTSSFVAMSQAWEKISPTNRRQLMTTYPMASYEESLKALLADTSALKAARNDLHLTMAEILENEIR